MFVVIGCGAGSVQALHTQDNNNITFVACPLSHPPFFLLLLIRRGHITIPPTKSIPPRMPDGVAGSSHPPVPNPPATFDLPGLEVSNRGGVMSG